MPSARSFTIRARIALAFAVVIAAGLGASIYGSWKLDRLARATTMVAEEHAPKVDALSEVKDGLNVMARGVRNIALVEDAAVQATELKRIADTRVAIAEATRRIGAMPLDARERELLQAVVAAVPAYTAAMDQALALAQAGRREEAGSMLLKQVRAPQAAYFKALDGMIHHEQQQMREASAASQGAASAGARILLGSALVATTGGALMALGAMRSISRPLQKAVLAAGRIRDGDLTQVIVVERHDELGALLQAMGEMQHALARVVADVRSGADSVSTASGQIAAGNQDLSQRTERQASALQQTASTMEELGSTVGHSAENARQADQLAQEAATLATRGGSVVGRVVSTMNGISDSGRRIGDIIGVIDGIAFQTNILALNAAVEAARAGEQGRGFAVVAAEVRTLAQRSAEAAREIKSLITSNVEQVEQGTSLVGDAGRAMEEIVGAIRRVSDIVAEISSAAAEQREGIVQVGHAVGQMDQATQQNAALVEQSAAAAESLSQQAQQLVQAVAVFRLGGSASAH